MKGPLKTHGGKRYLAERLVALMPPHTHYVEPFAGGLSVLFAMGWGCGLRCIEKSAVQILT